MSRRSEARKHWFTEGARALRALLRARGVEHLLPSDDDWYACPLCLDAFTIDVLDEHPNPPLTDEHAPPEWAGGRPMALTCRRCNNESGRRFDSAAQKQDFLHRFVTGQTADPMQVKYTVDGVVNYGNLYTSGNNGYVLSGVKKANNEADIGRMIEVMDSYGGEDTKSLVLNVESTKMMIDFDAARVSWIRTAYLVAFARFGWRYVLQPALEPLRAQFRDVDTITLPILSMIEPEADPTSREVWLVQRPVERRCIMVVCGRHRVFLPLPGDSRSLDQFSSDLVGDHDLTQPARDTLIGDMYPWPNKPYYSLDPVPAD